MPQVGYFMIITLPQDRNHAGTIDEQHFGRRLPILYCAVNPRGRHGHCGHRGHDHIPVHAVPFLVPVHAILGPILALDLDLGLYHSLDLMDALPKTPVSLPTKDLQRVVGMPQTAPLPCPILRAPRGQIL